MSGDAAARNRSRLAELLLRDRRRLTRFVEARLFGDGGGQADDIVSDVVLRLLERADLLARVEDLTAYLYQALAHAVVDVFRRRRHKPDSQTLTDLPEDGEEDRIADPAPNPELAFAIAEERDRLSSALTRLPPAERAVWIAVEIEGWSFRELAEEWQEPIGTLLSRKSRAGQKLKVFLSTEEASVPGASELAPGTDRSQRPAERNRSEPKGRRSGRPA